MAYEKFGWPQNIISEICNRPTADVFFNEFRFEQSLQELQGRYYDIIIQHFKNGVSYRDIAKDMELSNSRISAIASDGIRKLRRRQKEFFGVDYDSIESANRICKSLSEENDVMKKELWKLGYDTAVSKKVNDQIILKKKIDEIDISVRTYNPLAKQGIKTFGDISKLGRTGTLIESRLLRVRGFGPKCLKELKQQLEANGYSLEQLASIEYERWFASLSNKINLSLEGRQK